MKIFYTLIFSVICSATLSQAFDIETAWIERYPKDVNPGEECGSNDRPQPGETNWWEIHVYNNSTVTSEPYTVNWRINSMPVWSNAMPALAPQSHASASNRWIVPFDYTYDFSQPLTNSITAEIIAPGDVRTNNNALSVLMDALTFQMGIFTGTFHHYTEPDTISIYERINIMFARLNRKLAEAVFPRAPNGILNRYRIDSMYIDTIRMVYSRTTHPEYAVLAYLSEPYPNGTPGGVINYPWYNILWFWYPNTLFEENAMNAFIHECGHTLQTPDIYNFNLSDKFNYVNPGVKVLCDWMDPPGKYDIMRTCYQEDNSVFSEYEAIAINMNPGQPRPVTPEMINGGPGNTNWGYMFRDLQDSVTIKLYNTDGHELEGIPVKTYRGLLVRDNGYPNLCFSNTVYHQGTYKSGYSFTPNWAIDTTMAAKMNNCFQIAVKGQDHTYFHVLDQPRFNYRYWLGETNTVVFSLTNSYTASDITSFVINNGETETDTRHVTLAFDVTTTPRHMKVANSVDDISSDPWLPYGNPIGWSLPDVLGWHTVCVQVISHDFVPSEINTARIELIPEPGLLIALLTGIGLFLRRH